MFNEHSTEAIVKTKSWGFWLILALVITGAYTMVFGVLTVQQINEELVVEEYVDMNNFIPFYNWFNGETPLEHPALETPIAELNNHTLREVFEGGNSVPNFKNSDTLSKQGSVTYSNGVYTINAVAFTSIKINNINNVTSGDSFYFKYKVDETTSNINIFSGQFTVDDIFTYIPITRNVGYNTYLRPAIITGNNKQSYIGFVANGTGYVKISEWYVINRTLLGISSLTVAQMDQYFSQYQYYTNYTDFNIYSQEAYNVSRETLNYYYELYQKLSVLQGERPPVKIVSVNPQYNVELGASIMATLKNTANYIQTTANGLPRLYNDIKNIMGDIGKWFS